MSQTIGCAFDHPKESTVDGDWRFSGKCAGAFRKRGLLVGGQILLAPLSEALKTLGVQHLDVVIRHPRTGFSRFTDNGWTPVSREMLPKQATLVFAKDVRTCRVVIDARRIDPRSSSATELVTSSNAPSSG